MGQLAGYARVILLALTLVTAVVNTNTTHAPTPTLPVMGVWSTRCASFNITSTNPACGTLTPNNQFTVEINITDAPGFNGYEFFLYYDQAQIMPLSTDVKTGTLFNNPFKVKEDLGVTPGTIRMAVVNLGGGATGNTGVLCHINFNILASGESPLVLAAGTGEPSSAAQSWSRINLATQPFAITTTDGYFKNVSGKSGPVTSFTFSPPTPSSGSPVTFDATASYDPDNPTATSGGIVNYVWDFGDGGGAVVTSSVTTHLFATGTGAPFIGNFSVRVTVTDSDDGFIGIKTELVTIGQIATHDIQLVTLTASPASVSPGQNIAVTANVANVGTFSETFNLTITYGPPTTPVKTFSSQVLAAPTSSAASSQVYVATIDTTPLTPGQYEVDAIAIDPSDNYTLNNSAKTIFTVVEQSNSPFLLIAGGGIAVVAALAVLSILLRRRRRLEVE